jgi:hypothetical protein
MRHPFLVLSMLAGVLSLQRPALAADVAPLTPPPVVVAVPPPAPAATACWRYGGAGWGWYPCYAGPPAYWHSYHYGWRPDWARHYRW